MSSKPTLDLLYVCQELCRRSILTEVYDGGALSLAFAQAEFRELTYSRIPALSRRILHLNIAQALADLSPASVPDLDALTAYHYDQGGDQFHAMQYKVHRFKTYVVFNYALLNGMPREGEVLLELHPPGPGPVPPDGAGASGAPAPAPGGPGPEKGGVGPILLRGLLLHLSRPVSGGAGTPSGAFWTTPPPRWSCWTWPTSR